ncbi:Bifunctional acetohydroxyacid reductoisomerase [Gonapodya sp. JEL0774]|nr:Bifunctional acetohydroxyacid reductoisomerase [Gonapodya sp. JEL0774]
MQAAQQTIARAVRTRAAQAVAQRGFASAAIVAPSALRAATRSSARPVVSQLPVRGVKTLDFAGTKEIVYERSDFPKAKLQQIFKDDVFAVVGYGTQGRAQALNLRDNGLKVIVGLREGPSYELAKEDGFVPGETLFPIAEAAQKGSVIMYLLSDAGQKTGWPALKPFVTTGKTLYFSHGFSVVFPDQTGVVPPADVDVILAAPKGSGTSVRRLFLEGKGINGSVAVWQDYSGKAHERACAMGVGIGCGYLYETTFQKEVYSDLTGERGILMGAIQGMFKAQYDVLRSKGHSPSEAFNETVEEATQSLYPLIGENGMDWMYANCSTTAQRGALDWWKPFYDASLPVFQKLYHSVETGEETRRSIESNSRKDYRQQLDEELRQIRDSEMWRAGQTVRSLRPERQSK